MMHKNRRSYNFQRNEQDMLLKDTSFFSLSIILYIAC